MKTASIRPEESLWRSIVTCEQLLERKKEQSSPSQETRGRTAQVWVNVRGGVRMFAAYFWLTEGWTPRSEAILETVLKRARATMHPWLITCDANLNPEDFERSLWFRKDRMHEYQREFQRAGRKVPKENGLSNSLTMS